LKEIAGSKEAGRLSHETRRLESRNAELRSLMARVQRMQVGKANPNHDEHGHHQGKLGKAAALRSVVGQYHTGDLDPENLDAEALSHMAEQHLQRYQDAMQQYADRIHTGERGTQELQDLAESLTHHQDMYRQHKAAINSLGEADSSKRRAALERMHAHNASLGIPGPMQVSADVANYPGSQFPGATDLHFQEPVRG